MPVVENLTLEAAVSDEFTDTLANLQATLLDVAQTAESVFPIEVDERGIESTIGQLETLDAAVSAVDDDVTVGVANEIDGDLGDTATRQPQPDAAVEADVETDEAVGSLARLQAALLDIEQTANRVFPIEVDERGVASTVSQLSVLDGAVGAVDDGEVTVDATGVGDTISQLGAVDAAVSAVDDDVTIDVGGDVDDVSGEGLFAGVGGDIPTPDVPDENPVTADGGDIRNFLTDPDARLPSDVSVGGFTEVGNTAFRDTEGVAELTSFLDEPDPTASGDLSGFRDPETFSFDDFVVDDDAITSDEMRELFGVDGFDPVSDDDTDIGGVDPLGEGDQRGLFQRLRNPSSDNSAFRRLRNGLQNLEFGIREFNQAFVALVPLTVALIGALPAAITGLAALGVAAVGAAGALGALGGLAIFGAGLGPDGEFSTENLQEEVDEIQEAFSEAFTPLARDLAPLVDESVNGIERLFNALAARGDALRAFTDEARAFGSFLIDRIPVVASQLLGFAEALSPILGGIGEAFASRRFFRGLAELADDVLPALVSVGQSIQTAIPALVKFSTGILFVVAAFVQFIGAISRVLNALGPLTTVLGAIVGITLVFATVQTLAAVASGTLIGRLIASAGAYVLEAQAALFASTQTVSFAQATALAATAVTGLAVAVFTLVPLLGIFGIGVGSLNGKFGTLDSNVRSATDALRQFGKQSRRVDGASFSGPSAGTPAGVGGGNVQQTTVNVQTDGSTDDAFEASNTASFNTNT